MKRTLVAAIIGLSTAGAAFGQGGHILLSNYISPPYAQIYWVGGAENGRAVTAADGLTFQVYYGAGVLTSYSQLTPGDTFQIDNTGTASFDPGDGHGPGGYFINVDQSIPTWSPGQTWTFGYRVISINDFWIASSQLWQENVNIDSAIDPPMPSLNVPGLAIVLVPEPSVLALTGLGTVSWLIYRRRR